MDEGRAPPLLEVQNLPHDNLGSFPHLKAGFCRDALNDVWPGVSAAPRACSRQPCRYLRTFEVIEDAGEVVPDFMPRPIRHVGSLDDGARHRGPGVTGPCSKELRNAGLEPCAADGEERSALTGDLRLMVSSKGHAHYAG